MSTITKREFIKLMASEWSSKEAGVVYNWLIDWAGEVQRYDADNYASQCLVTLASAAYLYPHEFILHEEKGLIVLDREEVER